MLGKIGRLCVASGDSAMPAPSVVTRCTPLLREAPITKAGWHPSTDHLNGTDVYGNYTDDFEAAKTFSVNFEKAVPGYNEVLIASGDCMKWLITTRTEIAKSSPGTWEGKETHNVC